jgi:hypothetical protein
MKKFREIRRVSPAVQQIDEMTGVNIGAYRSGPLGTNNEADDPEAAVFDLGKEGSIERINAFLGHVTDKPVIDVYSVVNRIFWKLSSIGLQFDIHRPESATPGRPTLYKLTYLGGRAGVLDQNFTVGTDDNISHRLGHGLNLTLSYTTDPKGLTLVSAKIVPGS